MRRSNRIGGRGSTDAAKRRMEREYRQRPAKPETYRDVNYKSRTEAAWAQTFDFLKWRHTYEPELLDGWSPDFVVDRADGGKLWIEVKPAFDNFWEAVRRKMENCRLDKKLDVLAFVYAQVQFELPVIRFGRVGLFDKMDPNMPDEWWWWDAILWWADEPVFKWGLAVPDLDRELLLSSAEVESAGGIVY